MSKPSIPRNPDFDHLRQPLTGLCWWCGAPATTSEHKYKRTDLQRMMRDGEHLIWGGDPQRPYSIKSVRKDPAVRFVKSLCEPCNTARSQPFDRAYDVYSNYIREHLDSLWHEDGMDMVAIYGEDWQMQQAYLARYFIKHFGCKLVEDGLTPPEQMADFLNGEATMPNVQLAFVARADLRALWEMWAADGLDGYGLVLGGLYIGTSPDRLTLHHAVSTSYITYIGVRFAWNLLRPVAESSFFPFPRPMINHFENEEGLMFPA